MIQKKRTGRRAALSLMICTAMLLGGLPASAVTLEQVKQRDQLYCGISTETPGFSKPDAEGNWHGLNVDICRAVAAAVLGDKNKVKFVPLTDTDHVTALLTGKVDLLSMNFAWSMSHDTLIGLDFCGVSYYDGWGFMVPVALNVQSALEFDRVQVCIEPAGRSAGGIDAFFSRYNLEYKVVTPGKGQSAADLVKSGKCNVVSGDVSRLAALKLEFADPDDYVILPELISRRPLGPVVRQGDDGWFNLVRWVLFGLVIAEDKEITSTNIGDTAALEDPEIMRILGRENGTGKGLGIDDDWLYRMIEQVGNYGEIFDRNLGRNSALQLNRNINALWNRGGLHYGPPLN